MLLVFISYKHPLVLLVDETLERRRGKKIKAKGYYRDAVRSSKSQVVNAMGLKWLVMAISLKSPMMKRALALPFFSVLEPSKKCDAATTPIPIRWVLVVDPTGKLDPLPLMSTDPLMTPERMIELFIDRWGLAVTFEETREHLGVETQRQWSDRAIARSTPVLMGLYSCVCLMANRLSRVDLLKVETTAWHKKEHVTFSDMLRAVRMAIWRDNLISRKGKITSSVENIPPEIIGWMDDIVRRMLQAA